MCAGAVRAHCPLPAYYILLSLACLLLCQPAQPSPRYWCTEHCALCTTTLPHTTHPPKRALSVARPSSAFFSHHTPLRPVFTHTHTHNNHRADLTSLLCALRQLPTRVVAASATTTRWRLVTEKRLVTQQAGCWNRRPKAETVGWKPCTGRGRVGMCCRVSVYHGVPCPSSPISSCPRWMCLWTRDMVIHTEADSRVSSLGVVGCYLPTLLTVHYHEVAWLMGASAYCSSANILIYILTPPHACIMRKQWIRVMEMVHLEPKT